MSALAIGDIVEAAVTRVEAYGVYLHVGENEILVLIPDVSYERVDLTAKYKLADSVRVRILAYVAEKNAFRGTIKDA
jgi:ribosomal protein S1